MKTLVIAVFSLILAFFAFGQTAFSQKSASYLPLTSPDYTPQMGISLNQLPYECVAFAVAHLKTYWLGKMNGWDPKDPAHQVSPTAIYNQMGVRNKGIIFDDAYNLLINSGPIFLDEFPICPDTVPVPLELRFAAMEWRSAGFGKTASLTEAKTLLLENPINAVVFYANGGSHAITLVQYSDTVHLGPRVGGFKFQNCLGPGWANNGFSWISYEEMAASTYYYLIEPPSYQTPDAAFYIESNLFTKGQMIFGPGNDEAVISFLNGVDTVRQKTFVPVPDNFVIGIDSVPEYDKVILKSGYQARFCAPNFPLEPQMYSCKWHTSNTLVNLDFESEVVNLILDSIQLTPYHKWYDLSSQMTATIYMPALGKVKEKERVDFIAYPNPFFYQTSFRFTLAISEEINLAVYDLNGRFLSLVAQGRFAAGTHEVPWASDLAPGIYFAKLSSTSFKALIKIIIK